MKRYLPYILFLFFIVPALQSASADQVEAIKALIQQLKEDARGPYQDIRWFCPDGSINMPKEYCAEPGGIQHARYKEEVRMLGESEHIFLGQILAYTDRKDFWDADNNHSRMKQYQLQKYLRQIDDGWISRKGQYYRGAYQQEDEQAWALDFFIRLLADDEVLEKDFFLIRQAAKDITHRDNDLRAEQVWALAKVIAQEYPAFNKLRIKIHGQPEAGDLQQAMKFKEVHAPIMSETAFEHLEELIDEMYWLYQPADLSSLKKYTKFITRYSEIRQSLDRFIDIYKNAQPSESKLIAISDQLINIREQITSVKSRRARLALLDMSIALEEIFFLEINAWKTDHLKDVLDKICFSGQAVAGTGFIEQWEWKAIEGDLAAPIKEYYTLAEVLDYQAASRKLLDWGAAMPRAIYQDVVEH